jgi:hypothetical protein
MVGDVEWVGSGSDDDAAPADEHDDIVDVGRDRRVAVLWNGVLRRLDRIPRVVRWTAAAVAVAGLAVGLAATPPRAHRDGTSGGSLGSGDAFSGGAPEMVLGLAQDSRPLVNYVRSDSAPGSCALVPIGSMPQRRLEAAVHAALPDFLIRDVGRTLDQFTALCTLQLRARDKTGTTLIVQVAAAQQGARNDFAHLVVASRTNGVTTVSVATDITTEGWTVTVGTLGPDGDEPSSATLMQLAQDPSLLW